MLLNATMVPFMTGHTGSIVTTMVMALGIHTPAIHMWIRMVTAPTLTILMKIHVMENLPMTTLHPPAVVTLIAMTCMMNLMTIDTMIQHMWSDLVLSDGATLQNSMGPHLFLSLVKHLVHPPNIP